VVDIFLKPDILQGLSFSPTSDGVRWDQIEFKTHGHKMGIGCKLEEKEI